MEQALSLGLGQGAKNRNNTPGMPLANPVPPSLSGSPEIGQVLVVSPGSWTGQGQISFAFQWVRDGADLPGEQGSSYTLVDADDLAAIGCRVTASDAQSTLSVDTAQLAVTYPAPVFDVQPTISPLNAQAGSIFTLTLGAASPNATVAIAQFTLDGVDISAQLSGLEWDSSASAPGDILYSVSATNSGGTTVSNMLGAIVQAAPTQPAQFADTSWSVVDAGIGGALTVDMVAVPDDGGDPLSDIQYQIDGGAWISSGLSAPGSFQISGLTDDVSYTVALRAVNSVGAGAASPAKQQTPTAAVGGLAAARFGTTNSAGTGAFDTGGVASDGTFGAFSCTNGIITPTAPLSAGNYVVGGYPVSVSAGVVAVANQAEFDALGSADEGKTIAVRAGARIIWNQSTNSAFGRRRDMSGTVISGDGPDPRTDYDTPGADAAAHFDFIKFRSCAGIVLEDLRITPVDVVQAGSCLEFLEASGGGVFQDDVTIRRSVLKTSNPAPYGDYSNSNFAGKHGILCQANIPIGGISVHDCVFYGNRRSIELPATGGRFVEIVGNRLDMNYEDFIKISAATQETPVLLAGNYCSRGLSLSSDSGGPHADVLQYQGGSGTDANLVLEGNFFFSGDSRGHDHISGVWYIYGGSSLGVSGLLRACGNVDGCTRSMNPGKTDGFRTEYCATIPNDQHPVPYGSAQAGHRYDGGVTTAGAQLQNCFFGDYLDTNFNGNIAVQNCRKIKAMSASALTAALPAYPIARTAGPYTMAEFIDLFQTTPGGSLDTKGPAQILSLANGQEQSGYTLDGAVVPVPVLSSMAIVAGTDSFSATVDTSVDLNPIYWVVTPQGVSVSDQEAIKKRRVAGAVDYGYSKVPIDQVATPIALVGTAAALQANTGYTLHVFQENGWTKRSPILATDFSTN